MRICTTGGFPGKHVCPPKKVPQQNVINKRKEMLSKRPDGFFLIILSQMLNGFPVKCLTFFSINKFDNVVVFVLVAASLQ